MELKNEKLQLSNGNSGTWYTDYHNLQAHLQTSWDASKHGDLPILPYLYRVDAKATAADKLTNGALAACKKADPTCAEKADNAIYSCLNKMFKEESTAKLMILNFAADGTCKVGEGSKLLQQLIQSFTQGKSNILDIGQRLNTIMDFSMTQGEDIQRFLLRWRSEITILELKGEKVSENLQVQCVSRGLREEFAEVKKLAKRGEYATYNDLVKAVLAEVEIIKANGASTAKGLVTEDQAAKKAKNAAKKAAKKAKQLAAKDASTALPSKGGGKGAGINPTDANKQCWGCGLFGHTQSNCPGIKGKGKPTSQPAAEGVPGAIWCDFHQSWGYHTPDKCHVNPNSTNFKGGKGYGRGNQPRQQSGYNYPPSYKGAKGKGGGRGYGFYAGDAEWGNPQYGYNYDDSARQPEESFFY